MADQISGNTGARIGGTSGADYAEQVDQTIQENQVGKALTYQVAPLPDVQSFDLIGSSQTSESLRLATPMAANPFEHSPLGPRQDHLLVLSALTRATKGVSSDVVRGVLSKPISGINERDNSHMRASLAREDNMLKLLHGFSKNAEQIRNQVTGNQKVGNQLNPNQEG